MTKEKMKDRYERLPGYKHPVVKQNEAKQVKYSDGLDALTLHAWRRWCREKGYVLERNHSNVHKVINPFNMKEVKTLKAVA
jgi:hypothetical protein